MLYQLHWQHRIDSSKTIFIAQDEAKSSGDHEAMHKRFEEVLERRKHERPSEEYIPMICTQDSEYFTLAVVPDTALAPLG